jgi:hypothetical protein
MGEVQREKGTGEFQIDVLTLAAGHV